MARKRPVEESIERLAEEKIYEKVYEEVASGVKREGLWFKALSESDGEETKAKALYVKLRVRSLIDELIETEKAQYKEEKRYENKLASSKKRAAASDGAFRFISYISSIILWIIALFCLVRMEEGGVWALLAVIGSGLSGFMAYEIWPKRD
jgi:hypothetical protein